MARITARVDTRSLRLLQRQLERMPERILDGARNAVDESGEAIREDVEQNVRVWRGLLKNRVRVRSIGSLGLTADVGWFDSDTYYAKFQEFGTSSISADPVLTVAAERERGEFPTRLRHHIRAAL
ncbi:HK97-gp10 family putative phage morphogenesis protein [Actinomadura fulvescens]|uniref:HK97 gp10 family phage protein n=1 Tax=Actinomadura fulvescens TaxID=46160 RepID=A0ABN3Q1M3_9ACTN